MFVIPLSITNFIINNILKKCTTNVWNNMNYLKKYNNDNTIFIIKLRVQCNWYTTLPPTVRHKMQACQSFDST